jgi:hypothetical protein
VFLAPPGAAGSAFEFNFAVRTANGHPVGGYWIEIWHADSNGVYDLSNPRPPDAVDELWPNTASYRTRRYIHNARSRTVWTVSPGQYFDDALGVAREPHLHVVVDVPSKPLLTTQVFMPRDASLPASDDPHYDPGNALSPVVRLANGTTMGWFVFRVPVTTMSRTGAAPGPGPQSVAQRRLLAYLAVELAGRTNAWTTVSIDFGGLPAGDVVASLEDLGLIERYGDNGVKLTRAGIGALRSMAEAERPDQAALEHDEEREREHARHLRHLMPARDLRHVMNAERSHQAQLSPLHTIGPDGLDDYDDPDERD